MLHVACLCCSTFASFPSSTFVKQTKSLDSQMNSTSLTFVLKHFINLAADGLGPWSALSAGVYGIRYAWNTFDLTEGFSHVFPTAPMVCAFKQILWVSVCLSLCTCLTVSMCWQMMHDWPELLLQFAVECEAQRWREEGQRQMRNRDERIKGKKTPDSKVWDSGGVPTVLCDPLHITQTHLTCSMTTLGLCFNMTFWLLSQDWQSLLHLFWISGFKRKYAPS